MDVKPGYKQTEVGVIPEDWEVVSLSHFWNVQDCKHVTAQFVTDGFPIASIREVQSRFVDLTKAKQTTSKFYTLLTEGGRKPRAGDLIVSRNATVGEVAQVAEWHPLFAMGQDVCLLRKSSPEFSTDYLQSVFRSHIVVNQLSDLMVGSTFKRANVQQIKNFVVPMPPPPEQCAIAEALSDADALIEALEQLIAKKRQVKQGAMQELLTGKRRLPGFSGEWETWTLGQLFDLLRTANNSRSELAEEGDIGYLHYGDIHTHATAFFDFTTDLRTFIPRAKVSTIPRLADGDLVMADASEDTVAIGKAVEVRGLNGREAVAGLHTMLLRPRKDVLADGFKGYLQFLKSVRTALVRLATGVSVYGITKSGVKAIEVTIPKPVEQAAIAAILSDMDEEIAALEDKLAKARQIKQGMMQELLTGRIRLV